MTIFPPFSAPADKVPLPNTPPYRGAPAQGILYLFMRSRLQSLASPQNYPDKPIPSSHANQGSPRPLVTTGPASHRPYLLCSQMQVLSGPVWHVTSSSLGLRVQVADNCAQSHLPGVECRAFRQSCNPRVGLWPCQHRGGEAIAIAMGSRGFPEGQR